MNNSIFKIYLHSNTLSINIYQNLYYYKILKIIIEIEYK